MMNFKLDDVVLYQIGEYWQIGIYIMPMRVGSNIGDWHWIDIRGAAKTAHLTLLTKIGEL